MLLARTVQVAGFLTALAMFIAHAQNGNGGTEIIEHRYQISSMESRLQRLESGDWEKRLTNIEAKIESVDWMSKLVAVGTLGIGGGQIAGAVRRRRREQEQ